MQRRQFIALLGATVAAGLGLSFAQAKTTWRLAIASPADPLTDLSATGPRHFRAFFERMRSHGYVEGQNLLVERYSAEARPERYSGLVRDVVSHQPDAILTISTPLTREFKQATSRIPIVSVSADPVGTGLVESEVRPGGNITGVAGETGLELGKACRHSERGRSGGLTYRLSRLFAVRRHRSVVGVHPSSDEGPRPIDRRRISEPAPRREQLP